MSLTIFNPKRALCLALLLSAAAPWVICASSAKTSASIGITIGAAKGVVEGGGPLKANVAITNVSGSPITLRLVGLSDFLFDVELADGKHAKILKYYWEQTGKRQPKEDVKDIDHDTTHGNFAIATLEQAPLAPKQVVKYDGIALDNMYDVSSLGEYVIQLGMVDPVTHAVVESNKITVTVTK